MSTYHCYLKGKVEEIIIRWKMKRNVSNFFRGVLKAQCLHWCCDPHNW